MRLLSAHDVVGIWEAGENQHPLEQALTILSSALPEVGRDQLARLTLGQRDRWLLDLREKMYGSVLRMFAICPGCAQHLELRIPMAELKKGWEPVAIPESPTIELEVGSIEVTFRLPNTLDLASAAAGEDVETGRAIILKRCVEKATDNGVPIAVEDLPAEVIEAMGKRAVECDAQAETFLDTECPICGHRWQPAFDIGAFFWKEIAAHAKRLLREVHTLAAAYKWREAEILSMNPNRRQYYLDMVGS
jgi:hypothetical protein